MWCVIFSRDFALLFREDLLLLLVALLFRELRFPALEALLFLELLLEALLFLDDPPEFLRFRSGSLYSAGPITVASPFIDAFSSVTA